jgi:hypothetical protein
MIKIEKLPTIAGALFALGVSAAPVHAQALRTCVSGRGTDSGDCTRAAPCRTLAFAITQTVAGGEIDVLDPAGYGTVTITKAISIINDGVGVAGITAGVAINAGATDSVHLRGLTIEALLIGSIGIQFNTGGNLAIENCAVRNFAKVGINISPSTTSSFSVANTIASGNGGTGIIIAPTGSAVVKGVLSKVTANDNFFGISVDGEVTTGASLNVTIVDSEASNNVGPGVVANSSDGNAPTAVMVRNVVASNNGTGLEADTNATLLVAHSVVTGNGTGVNTSVGGAIQSYGDNDIDGNANDNTGVLTPLPMH